ncbi:hypothetical protein [Pantoea ananatis]|uniref:hypothetical protein n=1 Tax=Pantoea ananas TaxID=553 RepID=UPI00301B2810
MKTIADYLDSQGTGPAVGKDFKLYGMSIGKFVGATNQANLLFSKDGETMEIPVAIKLPQFNLPGPIANPLLEEIKEV